jgi:hypothetical protein
MLLPSNYSTNTLATPSNVPESASGLMIDVPVTPGSPQNFQKTFALVTSLILCNRSSSDIGVFAKVVNGSSSAFIAHDLDLPSNVSFDVINGNKFTLKEGDKIYVWHNGSGATDLDAILSYTIHRPLTTYDV